MGISVSNIVSSVDVGATPRINEKKEKTIGFLNEGCDQTYSPFEDPEYRKMWDEAEQAKNEKDAKDYQHLMEQEAKNKAYAQNRELYIGKMQELYKKVYGESIALDSDILKGNNDELVSEIKNLQEQLKARQAGSNNVFKKIIDKFASFIIK